MRTKLFFLIFVVQTVVSSAANTNIKALLKELDTTINQSKTYEKERENRINRLKSLYSNEASQERRFELCHAIIEEYKSYSSDSSLAYITKNMDLVKETGNTLWEIKTLFQQAFILTSIGLFHDTEMILKRVPKEKLSTDMLIDYYSRWEQYYGKINKFIDRENLQSSSSINRQKYRDSILIYLPDDSFAKLKLIAQIEYLNGNYKEAENNIMRIYNAHPHGSREHAMISYDFSKIYMQTGQTDKYVEYLIMAAISDVKDAVKENEAILDLALWLYANGDIERAYTYIKCGLNDANFYHLNYRYAELTDEFKTITNAYQEQSQKHYIILKYFTFLLVVLLIGLSLSLFFNQKHKREVVLGRKNLDDKNKSLEHLTTKQDKLILELSESNHIKEEYISHFIDLYSHYIAKYDDYRKMINNKIRVKRFDDLLKMTDSSSQKANDDVKALYSHFDQAFLAIYPGFVESINSMLKEEEQFEVKTGELNRELRIFALIRLGITDTAQIAKFLRCSIQTVYNYRSRIRKRAINENEDIEERIKLIGKY